MLRGRVERFGDHSLVLPQFCVSNQFPGVLMNLVRVILKNQGSGGDKGNSWGLGVSICSVCESLQRFDCRGATPEGPHL